MAGLRAVGGKLFPMVAIGAANRKPLAGRVAMHLVGWNANKVLPGAKGYAI